MKKILMFVIAITIVQIAFAQISLLEREIAEVIKHKDATVGIALYDFSNGDTLSINGDRRFPMKSVYKFHIALAVLNQVDMKRLRLDQNVFISKKDLLPNTWSPIREKYPEGDITLPLSEIIKYTVAQSDNNGCDILLKILGGASKVNTYIHDQGVSDVNIQSTEQELNASWNLQFDNWTTPDAAVELLKLFTSVLLSDRTSKHFDSRCSLSDRASKVVPEQAKRVEGRQLLHPNTHSFLWQVMANTSTGSVKTNLPKDAVVAHKTGYSGYKDGVCAANNDIGIMVLPDGRKIAYAIFITDSKEANEVNYSIIAEVAEKVYFHLR